MDRMVAVTSIDVSPSGTNALAPPIYRLRTLVEEECECLIMNPRSLELLTSMYRSTRAEELCCAFPKLHQCDFAVSNMIGPMSDKLREVGAKVDWVIVSPQVKFYLVRPHEEPGSTWHSMFSITSRSGEMYVVDYTLEQFGHHPDNWFLKESEYRDRVHEGW